MLQTRLGDVDFADLIFVRSSYFVEERRKTNPEFEPKYPTLFGEREGKIARANRGRDPMYLFSALQRQLGYPEVPRPRRPDELEARVLLLEQKIAQLENRIKLAESELNQDGDLSQVVVNPEDTAGVPSGWGKKGGEEWSVVSRCIACGDLLRYARRGRHRRLHSQCRLVPAATTVIHIAMSLL